MYLKSFLVDRSDSQTLQKFAKRGKGMKRRFTWRVVTTSYTGVHLINQRILINISLNTNWFYISITHQKKIVCISSARRGAFYYLDNLHSESGISWGERKTPECYRIAISILQMICSLVSMIHIYVVITPWIYKGVQTLCWFRNEVSAFQHDVTDSNTISFEKM